MSERKTTQQGKMLGHGVKNARSKTSRSGKCNDRERRTLKRADKARLVADVRAGKYQNILTMR